MVSNCGVTATQYISRDPIAVSANSGQKGLLRTPHIRHHRGYKTPEIITAQPHRCLLLGSSLFVPNNGCKLIR